LGLVTNILNGLGYFGSSNFYKGGGYNQIEQIGNKESICISIDDLEKVYLENPHLRSVIDTDASMLSNLKWVVRNSKGEIQEKHPALAILNRPNPLGNGKEFITAMRTYELIHGNAFASKIQTSLTNEVKAMYPIPPQHLEVNLTGKLFDQLTIDGIIAGYKFKHNNYEKTWATNEVIRIKQKGVGVILGESKIKTLKQQISNIKYVYESRNVLLNERGGIGILSTNSDKAVPMSPRDRKSAEKKAIDEFGIGKGKRKIHVSSLGLKWQPMTFPTKDLMLFEEVADDFNVILDAYGHNMNIYSSSQSTTFQNFKESLKAIYQNVTIPASEHYAEIFTRELIGEDTDFYIDAELSVDALQQDAESRYKALNSQVDATIKMSDNNITEEDLIA